VTVCESISGYSDYPRVRFTYLAHNRIKFRLGGSFYPRICNEPSRYFYIVRILKYKLHYTTDFYCTFHYSCHITKKAQLSSVTAFFPLRHTTTRYNHGNKDVADGSCARRPPCWKIGVGTILQ